MKKSIKLLLILILNIIFIDSVFAMENVAPPKTFTRNSGTKFYFTRLTGVINTSGAYSNTVGVSTGKYFLKNDTRYVVHCVDWDLKLNSANKTYKLYDDSKFPKTGKDAIVSGYVAHLLNSNNGYNISNIGKIGSVLNYYYRYGKPSTSIAKGYSFKNKDGSGTTKFNSELKSKLDEAVNYYNSIKKDITVKSISKPKISPADPEVSYQSADKYFITEKINVTGLVTKYGANESNVDWKMDVIPDSGVTAKVCTSTKASSCKTDTSINISGNSYSFYLRLEGNNISGKNVSVKFSASNKDKYYTSYLYYDIKNEKGFQHLIYPGTFTVSRSASKKITVDIPNIQQYNLTVKKVDENGEAISGSNFVLSHKTNGTINWSNGDSGKTSGVFKWNSGLSTDTYNFSDFSVTEVTTPQGFVSASNGWNFSKLDSKKTCYDTENGVSVSDNNYCNKNIQPICYVDGQPTTDVTPEHNCATVLPEEDTSSDQGTEEGDGTSSEQNQEPSQPDIRCYDNANGVEVDSKYCANPSNYVEYHFDGKNLSLTIENEKNSIDISKRDITGEDELLGAFLKICTKSDYTSKGNKCDAAKNINDESMEWVSSNIIMRWSGIRPGDYVIVETVSPEGYIIVNQAKEFSVDAKGKITSSEITKIDGVDTIIVNNTPNSLIISKRDITNGKELAGATLSLCYAIDNVKSSDNQESSTDEGEENLTEEEENPESDQIDSDGYSSDKWLVSKENGECVPVKLYDGTDAQWESTNEEHKLVGLPAGTYYLIEKISPKGYDTANPIKFTMLDNGTLIDSSGNAIEGNRLIMNDTPIPEVKTGDVGFIAIVAICFGIFGFVTYLILNKDKSVNIKNISSNKK